MSSVKNALIRTRSVTNHAQAIAVQMKTAGGNALINLASTTGLSQLSQFQQQGANRQRYNLFHGWVHAAIHAIGEAASSQPIQIGKKTKKKLAKKPSGTKSYVPNHLKTKLSDENLELIPDHPLMDSLLHPNMMQSHVEFAYTFVANLCLTGWAFVVGGPKSDNEKDGYEFYSIPTTWVEPNNEEGPFSKFRIRNPNNPEEGSEVWFTREQIGFAYFPNPADPLQALSLTQAQQMGIKIDDHIQTSQSVFFENGVFPSVIVTVGQQPLGTGVAGNGLRPRLSGPQRRQIYAAIKKTQAGVANYGNPAIIDGLIEKIERVSATQTEMGWEKSEKSVRTRILSAFGVHPFILGEEMAGSYAQAYIVEERFCKRVNTFLSKLSIVMTGLCAPMIGDEELLIWWKECESVDKQQEGDKWKTARTRGDVTQNEYRAYMGLPPDPDGEESEIEKTAVQAVTAVAVAATGGTVTPEQAQAILEGFGLSSPLAKRIAGEGPAEPPSDALGGAVVDQNGKPIKPTNGTQQAQNKPPKMNQLAVSQAAQALKKVTDILSLTPDQIADDILSDIEKNCTELAVIG